MCGEPVIIQSRCCARVVPPMLFRLCFALCSASVVPTLLFRLCFKMFRLCFFSSVLRCSASVFLLDVPLLFWLNSEVPVNRTNEFISRSFVSCIAVWNMLLFFRLRCAVDLWLPSHVVAPAMFRLCLARGCSVVFAISFLEYCKAFFQWSIRAKGSNR